MSDDPTLKIVSASPSGETDKFVDLAEQLAEHRLMEMVCNHEAKTDVALCACGWRGKEQPCVGDAAEEWAAHALLAAKLLTVQHLSVVSVSTADEQFKWWFDEREASVIDEIATKMGISRQKVLQQALRCYQLIVVGTHYLAEMRPVNVKGPPAPETV